MPSCKTNCIGSIIEGFPTVNVQKTSGKILIQKKRFLRKIKQKKRKRLLNRKFDESHFFFFSFGTKVR